MSENSRLLSLNHDLGDDADETGSNVLLWIEQKVATINLNYHVRQHGDNTLSNAFPCKNPNLA